MLLGTGAKTENLSLIKLMNESEDDTLQVKLSTLLDIVLNLCASIVKVNVKGQEEFAHVLSDLKIDRPTQEGICQVFQAHYLERVDQLNNVYEDNSAEEVNQKYSKKHPLDLSMADDSLVVSNPKLVDVSWRVIHTLSTMNLNKVFQPRFLITLTLLT